MNKVMIVDDSTFMRMMLKDILNQAGFKHVIEAKTAGEALIFQRVERPAVILLDLTMPDMDGLEALTKMKNHNPDVHVIMCSSMGQEEVTKECFEKGANDFILKPFKPERIIQALTQFISPDEE